MINRPCPVPSCIEPVPSGPHAAFCAAHHFQLPYRVTKQIFALKIACARTEDDEARAHLRAQIDAHVRIAVRSLTEASAHVA